MCLQTCVSLDSSELKMINKVNKAIDFVLKDSLFMEYEKNCSSLDTISFKIKQEYSFSFFLTYLVNKNRFDSLLIEYLESNINPFINQRNFIVKDSLRYLSEISPKLELKLLKYYNSKSPNLLLIDIVDSKILQLNIETVKCPYKGIQFIFLISKDSVTLFSKSFYNY
jgi:hypothetical protein